MSSLYDLTKDWIIKRELYARTASRSSGDSATKRLEKELLEALKKIRESVDTPKCIESYVQGYEDAVRTERNIKPSKIL